MSFEITFEMLFGHRCDRLSQPTCKSAPLEGDSVQIMISTSNLILFDRKGGYSKCKKGTHSTEHNCASLSFPSLSSSKGRNQKKTEWGAVLLVVAALCEKLSLIHI